MAKKSDSDLMIAFRGGEESAFTQLVDRHSRALVNYFYHLCRHNHAQAEDMAQEVFVRVYLHRKDYRPIAKFTTYLYKIARHCWIDYLRKNKHHAKVRSLDEALAEEGSTLADMVAAEGDTPADASDKKEFVEVVIEAIDSLPPDHRIVFVLSEVRGMKYPEISKVLNIPVGTVKSRMFNALKKLREKLGTLTAMEVYKKDN